jgi:hypothetical protein
LTAFSLKNNGESHLSVCNKSMQINPIRAPWITLARPGTLIEIRLRIVRKERSFRKPQINWINHDTPTLSITPTVVFVENKVMPPSKFAAIDC